MDRPITSWVELGVLVGKHPDTIGRWRRKVGDRTTPWWRNEEEAVAWWRALIAHDRS
jgi:hypothetical protein